DETDPVRSRCIRCETCDGHPCLVSAKSDAQVVCVDPALAHPNVTLLTGAYVRRLETTPSGRAVTGVIVERGGATEAYSADMVVVSAGATNSAALLLRSDNGRPPRGPANGSGVVGRHYRVTLDRNGDIALSYAPNNEEGHQRLIDKLKGLMRQQTRCRVHGHECHEGLFARNLYLGQRIPLAGVAHQNGTVRFGHDA